MSGPKAVGYALTLPIELYEEILSHAVRRNTTVLDLVKQMMKLGLIALATEERDDARLLIEDDAHGQRELRL